MITEIGYIYSLICPISLEIKYIGKTVNPIRRKREHFNIFEKTRKGNWVKSLKQQGLTPIFKILKIVSIEDLNVEEINTIKQYDRLLNDTEGGTGGAVLVPICTPVIRSDGKIYPSLKVAAKDMNCNSSNIITSIRQNILCKNFRWNYLGQNWMKPEHKKSGYIIYCSNGEKYYGPNDVEKKLGISTKTLVRDIKKCYKNNGLRFSYNNEFNVIKTGKKIFCVTNGKIYNSSREAAKELDLCYKQISQQLNGKQHKVKGYVFKFLMESGENNE